MLLVGESDTYSVELRSLEENPVGVAANDIGFARAALEPSTSLVNEPRIGSKKVRDFQAIQHNLAVMATEIEATKWLDNCGARWVDQGPLDAETALKAKLIASESALCATEQAIRIRSGAGIMLENPVGCFHCDALIYIIGVGTRETQRNVIARNIGL